MTDLPPMMNPLAPDRPPRQLWLLRPRLWVGLLVSALWLSVMGAIWVRDSGRMGGSLRQMGVSPEVLLVSWTDYDQSLWIKQRGRTIGLTQMTIRPSVDHLAPGAAARKLPGYQLNSHTRLNLRLVGFEIPIDLYSAVRMNAAFELETMQAAVLAAGYKVLMQAFTEPRKLFYRIRVNPVAGAPVGGAGLLAGLGAISGNPELLKPQDICGLSPLAEPVFMIDAVIPVLTRTAPPKVGERWTTRASDPLSGLFHTSLQISVDGRETLSINGETLDTCRMTERLGDMQSKVWYDLRGRIVRRDLASGLSLIQASPGQAHAFDARFDHPYDFHDIDREWMKKHIDPKLNNKPLSALLPQLPALVPGA